jgi:AraC-like DNA-binding protein
LTLRFSPASLARLVPRAIRRDSFDVAAFALHALLPPELMLARSLLWRKLSSGYQDPLEIEELGVSLLARALQLARKDRKARRSIVRQRQVRRVIESVCVEPERRWTLASLAELAGVSPWHLAHVFRADTGLSVYQYVLRARLAATLPAVLDTRAELAAIALDAGFASHSHFTARFRSLFGWTPQQLRRKTDGRVAAELRKNVTARV